MPAYAVLPFEESNGVILCRVCLIIPIDSVFAVRETASSDELRVKILLGNRKDRRLSRLFA